MGNDNHCQCPVNRLRNDLIERYDYFEKHKTLNRNHELEGGVRIIEDILSDRRGARTCLISFEYSQLLDTDVGRIIAKSVIREKAKAASLHPVSSYPHTNFIRWLTT